MKNQNPNNADAILHGECIIFQSRIPENAAEEQHSESEVIIAPSETTGNHHVIANKPGVTFLNSDGRRFVRCSVPTEVRCVIKDRHDSIPLPVGDYEIDSQQEFDYLAMQKRNVQD